MPRLEITFGQQSAALEFADGALLQPRAGRPAPKGVADVSDSVRSVLETPMDFPSLRLALTPEDEVAITVPIAVHQVEPIVTVVVEHILSAGVRAENITILGAAMGRQLQALAASHSRALRGVKVSAHDRADTKARAYLAGTSNGRALYMDRRLVDAGQVVVIGRVGYDARFGYRGGLDELFPAFSDQATWQEFTARPLHNLGGNLGSQAMAEAKEVGWLLGLPFLIQVLEGPEDSVTAVLAGTADSLGERSQRLLDAQERLHVSRHADLVIATITGEPAGCTFADVARAFAVASRVIRPGGAIAILSRVNGELGAGCACLRGADSPIEGLRLARQGHAEDLESVWHLATAAEHARLFLFSDLPGDAVEEMFITPLESPAQVQRLIEEAATTVLLPDAHRCLVDVA